MHLLNKIKYNYKLNLIVDYISSLQFNLASQEISKLKEEEIEIFSEVLKTIDAQLNDIANALVFKQKLIWTFSYDLEDLDYINRFLNFYLTKNLHTEIKNENFTDSLSDMLDKILKNKKQNKVKFNEMINYSGFYQNLLLFESNKDLRLLSSCSAFFESQNKKYFIYPNSTLCYFYILKNPNKIFLKYKNLYGSTEAAYDELLNYRNKLYLRNDRLNKFFEIYENRVNFNTNVKSWTDPNVISTYKGKIISYENLLNKTEDTLLDVIYHLKQYYPALSLEINDIQEFVRENKVIKEIEAQLTNSEIKFLAKNINYDEYLN